VAFRALEIEPARESQKPDQFPAGHADNCSTGLQGFESLNSADTEEILKASFTVTHPADHWPTRRRSLNLAQEETTEKRQH